MKQQPFLSKKFIVVIVIFSVIVIVCAVWLISRFVQKNTLVIKDNNNRSIDIASPVIRQADIISSFGTPESVAECQDSVLLSYDGITFKFFSPGGLDYSYDQYALGEVLFTGENYSVRGIRKGSSSFRVKLAFLFNYSQDSNGNKYTIGPMYDPKSVEFAYE